MVTNKPPERIFLIGFMGCGKSYTGKQLAQLLNYQFIDLDDRIEELAGMTISDIFARDGEDGFRILEQDALHELARHGQIVVACGGGTPCFFDNMAWMNQHGMTVYLQADADLLTERLRPGREHRPLIAAYSDEEFPRFIKRKLAARDPIYRQAHIIFEQRDVIEDVAGLLKQQISE